MSARAPRLTTLVAVAAATAATACAGSLEDPAIVIDLRQLAIVATPPEQVVDLDITNLPDTPEEFEALGLVDVEVCALVADPGASRRLSWRMTACGRTDSDRCDDPDRPARPFGQGVLLDPEEADDAQIACATLPADEALLLIIGDAIQNDPLLGFGQIDIQAHVEVWPQEWPEGATEPVELRDETVHGSKRIRFAARLPAERVANTNPTLTRIDADLGDGDAPEPLPLGRCRNLATPRTVSPGDRLHLDPIEPDGAREDYVVPTFDGGSRMFTETLRYQWLATAGSWSPANTGGTRDASGALPPLDTEWIAPDVDEVTDVSLWLIQRDERLGQRWVLSCVRVEP